MTIRILDHDYDQFILGTGPSGTKTLIHLSEPRFVCKVADKPDEFFEIDFVHTLGDGRTLHSIAFLDKPVTTPEEFTTLMAQAESALKRIE
nr:hypothetical protein [Pseudodesulfovibrio sp.]